MAGLEAELNVVGSSRVRDLIYKGRITLDTTLSSATAKIVRIAADGDCRQRESGWVWSAETCRQTRIKSVVWRSDGTAGTAFGGPLVLDLAVKSKVKFVYPARIG